MQRVKRWVYAYSIDLSQSCDPCFEGHTTDHLKEPVGIYMGLTFMKRPPVGVISYVDGHNLVERWMQPRQVWVQLT